MAREAVMTIKVKIQPTETLDIFKAIKMIYEVSCQLSDGYWEGTGLYREFFKLLDFEEDKTLDTMLITFKKPHPSELVLEENDAWEYEGGRYPFDSYEEYYKTAIEDWGRLPRDYRLKDAAGKEEVIDYIVEVMTTIIKGREARSLDKYDDKMLDELISALKKARDSKLVKVNKVKK